MVASISVKHRIFRLSSLLAYYIQLISKPSNLAFVKLCFKTYKPINNKLRLACEKARDGKGTRLHNRSNYLLFLLHYVNFKYKWIALTHFIVFYLFIYLFANIMN